MKNIVIDNQRVQFPNQNKTKKTHLEVQIAELQQQERKFARLQARRQGKMLLDCEYNKSLGCLGEDWCDNCQVNYPTTNQVQSEALKGGAC